MDRIIFPEGEQPEVLTILSEACESGRCQECPGVFHIEDDRRPDGILCP